MFTIKDYTKKQSMICFPHSVVNIYIYNMY